MAAFINDYRIKLHNAEDSQNELCVMASRVISWWKADENGTLIYVDGLEAPIMVKEPFEIVDGLMLRAIGVRKKTNATVGGVRIKTLRPSISADTNVATVLLQTQPAAGFTATEVSSEEPTVSE